MGIIVKEPVTKETLFKLGEGGFVLNLNNCFLVNVRDENEKIRSNMLSVLEDDGYTLLGIVDDMTGKMIEPPILREESIN